MWGHITAQGTFLYLSVVKRMQESTIRTVEFCFKDACRIDWWCDFWSVCDSLNWFEVWIYSDFIITGTTQKWVKGGNVKFGFENNEFLLEIRLEEKSQSNEQQNHSSKNWSNRILPSRKNLFSPIQSQLFLQQTPSHQILTTGEVSSKKIKFLVRLAVFLQIREQKKNRTQHAPRQAENSPISRGGAKGVQR